MPAGVVTFCPAPAPHSAMPSSSIPKTRFISFTGSKTVGLEIHERAAHTQKGQIWNQADDLEMAAKTPSWSAPTPI